MEFPFVSPKRLSAHRGSIDGILLWRVAHSFWWIWVSRLEDSTLESNGGVIKGKGRVAYPLRFLQRVGSSLFYAEESQARNGARRLAFYYVLFVSTAGAAGDGAGGKSGGADFGRSGNEGRVRVGRLRDHAGK